MSASSARKSRNSPRRKAGRASRKRTPRKLGFRLTVEGQEMLVSYTPNYFDGEFAQGHFEFRSPYDPPRRIPVSETGYRSHFAPMEDIAAAASPQDYAREIVLAFLNENARPAKGDARGQLSLF